MQEILSINTLEKSDMLKILKRAEELEKKPEPKKLDGKILSSVFFEPSTRTKTSFTGAMYRLGGHAVSLSAGGNNSLKKGESLSDTMITISLYSDIMAVRSPYEGTAKRASEILKIPVINAGDGANEHPTQTMLDLYTIQKEKGRLDNLNIAFVGDLKYGRTVHSLSKALNKFDNNKFYFVAPDDLQISYHITDEFNTDSTHYTQSDELTDEILKDIDVLYMTRVQEERFEDKEMYKRCASKYQIDKSILKKTKKDMKIMHPLPRIDEISTDLDDTPNAVYFSQMQNGLYVREAIMDILLDKHSKIKPKGYGHVCENKKCIATLENLSAWTEAHGKKVCFYCDQ